MERDHQKEKIISIEQAREIVKQAWCRVIADGTRYAWIGDDIKEYRGGYLIPTVTLKKAQMKPDSYLTAWVDYSTGEIHMGFDVTA